MEQTGADVSHLSHNHTSRSQSWDSCQTRAEASHFSQNHKSKCLETMERPHVLLLPLPAQGHINPFVLLGKKLAALGVQVTMATMPHLHEKITRAQRKLAQPVVDSQLDFRIVSMDDGLPPELDREKAKQEVWHAVEVTLEESALELIRMMAEQGRPVTCIVADYFLRWTCSLAEKTSLPEFVFWPQCSSVFCIYANVDAIIASGYDPFEANIRATAPRTPSMEPIFCIPGLPQPIHPADLPFECPFSFGKRGLDWMRNIILHRNSLLPRASGLVANSFPALEPEVNRCLTLTTHPKEQLTWPNCKIRLVGPLVPMAPSPNGETSRLHSYAQNLLTGTSLWEEEVEGCLQWLDRQPASSVVYVSFGSITEYSLKQVQEVASGLAASGQRFLWVIRKDAIKYEETLKDPSSDSAGEQYQKGMELEEALPQGLLELKRGKVVRWAPQMMVLSHPAVGGFFSHCGWNSTLESVCTGVPILGWPWLMDQVTNCWLASHVWKMGITLKRDAENGASAESVEEGVRELMEGPGSQGMRARARELSRLAQQEGAGTHEGLMALIDDIRKASAPFQLQR